MEFTGERYVPAMEGQMKYEHLHRYALCLELVAGKSVLDIASGEGYGAALLASVAESVKGVDIDAGSVEHARHLYYKPNLSFVAGSCDRIPLPDHSFDVVTSFETIEHHDKHEEMLDEIKRVLKPGGMLIISSPNKLTYSDEPGYTNPYHVKELYYDQFQELLQHRFKSIRMFGQRLAAGSFVFPLGTAGGSKLTSLTGDANGVVDHVRELPSPIYFIAVCCDDPAMQNRDLSSVYFDRTDDLLQTLALERVHDVRTMQEQVRHLEREIVEQRKNFEAEIARISAGYEAEINRRGDAIIGYNEELKQRDIEIECKDREIVLREDALAQLRAHWQVSEKNIRDHQANIEEYKKTLTETRAHLSRCLEILNWIYASRSWRLSNSFRQVEKLNERLSTGSRGNQLFEGQLEAPQMAVSDSLEVRGWVRSSAGPIMYVEAFLDDFYLGRIRYGAERPDGYSDRISLHGFNLVGVRTLRVRAHDQKNNRQVYACPIVIVPESQHDRKSAETPEIFQATLEHPAPNESVFAQFEVSGWVYSRAGGVTFVNAFIDDVEIGRVTYGQERTDVVKAFPALAPLRCGFSHVFSLKDVTVRGQCTLRIQFYDEKGNTRSLERPIKIEMAPLIEAKENPQSAMQEIPIQELPAQLKEVIAEFQNRTQRDPSVLDWDSKLNLAGALPRLAVFSPPPGNDGDTLPYFDHTIDVVVTSASGPARLAEGRRVAAGVFVRLVDRDKFEIEWQNGMSDRELQTTSIIIPVYNNVAYTRKCLDRVRETLPHNFKDEIIVVDDASSDDTPAVLEHFSAIDIRVKVFRNPKNSGFITSCNRGAKEASGEILVFLNNDTLPSDGWLPALLRVFREKRDVGAVGGKLVYPDGTLQEAGGVIFSDGSGCNFGKYDKAANGPLYSFLREVDYCSGALLATPRELFLELGGFDLRFQPAYYEDTDYCFTLREKGYRVYYQPESVIVHFEGISSGTDITSGVKSYQVVNRDKFVEKWRHVLQYQPAPPRRLDSVTLQQLAFSRSTANGYGK